MCVVRLLITSYPSTILKSAKEVTRENGYQGKKKFFLSHRKNGKHFQHSLLFFVFKEGSGLVSLSAGDLNGAKQSLLSLDFQEFVGGKKLKHETCSFVLSHSAYHFSN